MTRNTTSYRDKGRAVFLAALMVLSVFAAGAVFPGTAVAAEEGDTDITDVSDVYVGQDFTVSVDGDYTSVDDGTVDVTEGDILQIRQGILGDGDGDRVATTTVEENEAGELVASFDEDDTDELEEDFHFFRTGGENIAETQFEVEQQDLDAEFETSTAQLGVEGDAVLEIDSENRDEFDVELTADGFDAEDIVGLLDDVDFADFDDGELTDEEGNVVAEVREDDDGDETILFVANADQDDHPMTFSDVELGEYEINVDVDDTIASDTAEIEVIEEVDAEIDFTEDDYEATLGDNGEFGLTVDGYNQDDLYVGVGDEDDVGYEAIIHLSNVEELEDDEDIVIEFNTIADPNTDAAFEVVDSDVEVEEVHQVGIGISEESVLAATSYDLVVGTEISQDNDEVENEENFSLLSLNDAPSFDDAEVNTWTAPAGDDIAEADDLEDTTLTMTDEIAEEDQTLVSIETEGVFAWLEEGDEFHYPEYQAAGANIEITEVEERPNQPGVTWATYGAEEGNDEEALSATVISADQSEEEVIVLVENEGADFRTDAELEVTFDVTDFNPLVDDEDGESSSSSMTPVDRTFEFAEDPTEVATAADQEVVAESSVAPGTDARATARASGEFVKRSTSTIEDDGTVTFTMNFDGEDDGIEFDLSGNEQGDLEDSDDRASGSADGVTVAADEEPADELSVAFDQATYTVDQGDSVDVGIEVDAGEDDLDEETVTLLLNGDELDTQTVTVDAGDSDHDSVVFTIETNEEDFPVDDHDLDVELLDASDSATLTVEGDEEPNGDDDEVNGDDDEVNGDDDEVNGDDDEEPEDDDDQPGFGLLVALVSLLGAALLARRRNNN